jgi:hypothetical protein
MFHRDHDAGEGGCDGDLRGGWHRKIIAQEQRTDQPSRDASGCDCGRRLRSGVE